MGFSNFVKVSRISSVSMASLFFSSLFSLHYDLLLCNLEGTAIHLCLDYQYYCYIGPVNLAFLNQCVSYYQAFD